ncbi:MAG: helix-turn-helix transcriptional regulator [Leptolyngbya sp. SIO1E4]|nr:helix-turn-helix transcriptional regulator [Leptolyngbya sp. SIO1E4]
MDNSENPHSKGWDGTKPNLRELREALKITQRQLSDKIGVTENTIANWEHGRSIGKWLYQIKMLCQALDCSFEELTDGLETPLSSKTEKPFSSIRKEYQSAKKKVSDLES